MGDFWKIKSEIMWSILVPGRRTFEESVDAIKSRYNLESNSIDNYITDSGFGDASRREVFRQEFGKFLNRQTGIKLRGIKDDFNHPGPPDTLEKLRGLQDSRESIANNWNRQRQRSWHISYRLIYQLADREVRRLEYEENKNKARDFGGTAQDKGPDTDCCPGSGTGEARPGQPLAVKKTEAAGAGDTAEAVSPDGNKAAPQKEQGGGRPVLTLINGGAMHPGAEGSLPLPPPPEEILLQRGRDWLRELHLALGVQDPEAARKVKLQQQVVELECRAASLEQEKGRLDSMLANFGDMGQGGKAALGAPGNHGRGN